MSTLTPRTRCGVDILSRLIPRGGKRTIGGLGLKLLGLFGFSLSRVLNALVEGGLSDFLTEMSVEW